MPTIAASRATGRFIDLSGNYTFLPSTYTPFPGPGFIGTRRRTGAEDFLFCASYAIMRNRPILRLTPYHYAALEGYTEDMRELALSWVNNTNTPFIPRQIKLSKNQGNDSQYVFYGTKQYLKHLGWSPCENSHEGLLRDIEGYSLPQPVKDTLTYLVNTFNLM